MDLQSALADWQQETAHCREATTYTIKRRAARWIAAFGAETRLRDLDTERLRGHLLAYRATHAATTTNAERRYLSWFLGHCVRRGFLQRNPIVGTTHYPEERFEAHALRPEEMASLLQRAGDDLRAVLLLAVETGLRRSTVLSLRWEWVDLADGWIHIPPAYMKGRRDYRAPLSPSALAALRSIRASVEGRIFPFSVSALRRRITLAAARAGLDCTFHDLRRTFFTRMRERGVPLEIAMALSDHRDVRTALRHYRAISAEELLRAVGRGEQGSTSDVGPLGA